MQENQQLRFVLFPEDVYISAWAAGRISEEVRDVLAAAEALEVTSEAAVAEWENLFTLALRRLTVGDETSPLALPSEVKFQGRPWATVADVCDLGYLWDLENRVREENHLAAVDRPVRADEQIAVPA